MSAALLNYTTEISVERSIMFIQRMLIEKSALAVLQEYDGFGNVSALSFKIKTSYGVVALRLPANIAAVEKVLNRQAASGRIPKRFQGDTAQAARVAWRIVKDWMEAQLAIIETGMVEFEQVFLPYVQNQRGQTLYEATIENRFQGLALTDGEAK
jgi:hypothetical protein